MEGVNTACEKFHLPLLPVRRKRSGDLPLRRTFGGLASSALTFSAMKEAEHGGGVIIRLYNPTGSGVRDRLQFEACVVRAWKVSLNEESREELVVQENHVLPLEVPPWGIITVLVELESSGMADARRES
jgi:alpha-mannosidase